MANEKNKISRRKAIGGLGAGLAALTVAPVFGSPEHSASPALQDPTTKYPKPPFSEQSQPWPGLVSKMNPRPDHGETSYKGSGRLAGRKALITGGDSGMGRAAAIAFAREGADVAINYFPTEESDAREVIDLIKATGRIAVALPGDLRDQAFCEKLVSDAVRGLNGLDIVVNNAGRQQTHASILDISTEQFDWTMKTNIYAPFWIIKAALPHLQPGSAIIGTASEQAYDPSPDLYDYAQTKAATMNYIKSLAKQLAPKGIRVNGVAPGPIWTALQVSGGATQEKLKNFGGNTPFGRPGQPAELASIYVQLAAESGSYATGQIYGSSGGAGSHKRRYPFAKLKGIVKTLKSSKGEVLTLAKPQDIAKTLQKFLNWTLTISKVKNIAKTLENFGKRTLTFPEMGDIAIAWKSFGSVKTSEKFR